MLNRILFACLICLSSVTLNGCATANDHWVELAGQRYQVEIANDDPSRIRGLMFRDELAEGTGMLFIHEDEAPRGYWMKNTHIPLDILYFDNQRKLVTQRRNVPPCSAGDACPSYPSQIPARFVLELNAGQADQLNLQDGAELRLSKDIHVAPITQ